MDVMVDSSMKSQVRAMPALRAFHATPTGKKSIDLMPELARKGADIGLQRVQKHLPELEEMLSRRMRELEAGGQEPLGARVGVHGGLV